ncbi:MULTISPECIES: SRPBCC family protein [unclassified Brevundimonas]|uniref:SRPBCC family protein n=1 Tax=unclassified Brevundimonas TaxID=2622653 RepID=UPI0006FC2E0B|nr:MULTISPECIES: SRPBCC family protein [unclassified Brevundimonas]KQY95016.1 ATPase [Brevundimonas sp. Root1423]KRA28502.1 ATPase [Brevundimonas sp. Root608]
MSRLASKDAYGVVTEPMTLTIQRLLPGPIERVWDYLTEADLRRQWLAAGAMDLTMGGSFQFIWRNDELTDPSGARPAGAPEEHRLEGTITELQAPTRLAITWGSTGGVTFDLEASGDDVILTLTHHRLTDRATLLNIGAGWHAHLDLLGIRLRGGQADPFWDRWHSLKAEYADRISA